MRCESGGREGESGRGAVRVSAEQDDEGNEDSPSILLLHLVISLTLNTASGSHSITKTSSVETTEECFKSKSA